MNGEDWKSNIGMKAVDKCSLLERVVVAKENAGISLVKKSVFFMMRFWHRSAVFKRAVLQEHGKNRTRLPAVTADFGCFQQGFRRKLDGKGSIDRYRIRFFLRERIGLQDNHITRNIQARG